MYILYRSYYIIKILSNTLLDGWGCGCVSARCAIYVFLIFFFIIYLYDIPILYVEVVKTPKTFEISNVHIIHIYTYRVYQSVQQKSVSHAAFMIPYEFPRRSFMLDLKAELALHPCFYFAFRGASKTKQHDNPPCSTFLFCL